MDYTTRQMLKDIAADNVVNDDEEVRFDYDGRPDGNPVYSGRAPQGTATSEAIWKIKKMDYDGASPARITRMQAIIGAWDDRASLPWT